METIQNTRGMSRYDTPKEPQQQDIIVALLVLAALVLLCAWPNVLRQLLEYLKPHEAKTIQFEEVNSTEFEDWIKDSKSGNWILVKSPQLWRSADNKDKTEWGHDTTSNQHSAP